MSALARLLGLSLLLAGCSAVASETTGAIRELNERACGRYRLNGFDTVTGVTADCLRFVSSGDCIPGAADITSSCDLPDEPQAIWFKGDEVAAWCSVSEVQANNWLVPIDCVDL
jgi:hypothetical protein